MYLILLDFLGCNIRGKKTAFKISHNSVVLKSREWKTCNSSYGQKYQQPNIVACTHKLTYQKKINAKTKPNEHECIEFIVHSRNEEKESTESREQLAMFLFFFFSRRAQKFSNYQFALDWWEHKPLDNFIGFISSKRERLPHERAGHTDGWTTINTDGCFSENTILLLQ